VPPSEPSIEPLSSVNSKSVPAKFAFHSCANERGALPGVINTIVTLRIEADAGWQQEPAALMPTQNVSDTSLTVQVLV